LERVSTYSVVLALHIMAVLAAYGLPLAYPLLLPYVRARHPEALAGVHAVQYRLNVVLTGPGTALVLAFGIYLATKGHHWGEAWVTIPVVIIALIAVLGGAVIVPATRRLGELAVEDVRSEAYAALYRRYMAVEVLLGGLVLAAVFVMAAKP
jgi:hypothetical protein